MKKKTSNTATAKVSLRLERIRSLTVSDLTHVAAGCPTGSLTTEATGAASTVAQP